MALIDVQPNIQVPAVDNYLDILNRYASDAITSADTIAQNLSITTLDQYNPNVNFEEISSPVVIGSPDKPRVPSVNTKNRELPSAPTISTPTISIGSAPTFTEASPDINLPAVPNPLDISLPVKDFIINTDFDYPITPDTTLPSVPTFLELNIPTADTLVIPTFDLDFPTSNSLVVPGVTFSFSESAYSDTLLTKVKDELFSRLSTSTGLSPIVEEALWNRGRDRESRASLVSQRNLLIDNASRGFSRLSGAQASALELLYQETQSKIIDLSREIMIKQAELEQENIKTSISQTISLEDLLIKEHGQIAQRSFEVAKYIQDIAVEIFKISVSKYTAEVEAYKSFATAYSARVQAELAKIEIFKAKIDAEKLKNDINEQDIRLYLARIEGVKNNVEIYKALISTVSEKLKAEGLKLEVYRTDVDAYSSAVKAKADEFSIYSEQIKGELAKVEVFDSKVKAFASRIQAYSATNEVAIKRADIESQIQGLNIKSYESTLDAFIKQVQADQLIYQAAVDLYKGEVSMYQSELSLATAVATLDLKNSENVITQNKYKADIGISNAQITLESIKSAYTAMITARQSAGSIYQSLGASALSAINVSASLSGNLGVSVSESHNYNTSQ